jgi:pyruvate dehydrogenase E1 component
VLEEIQRRVLWLAVRIVDAANRERDTGDGVKVGGHQSSSASLVTAMTALYFAHLDANDRVSVKPHASPVFHAIQYLLGGLDRSYLTTLRRRGGLQSYPSRTKDPDRVDFSTGSVGLGAAAPLFAAATRRYVDDHFGARDRSRFVALIGDAELDEGNVWEAVADPATQGLGTVMWIVDFNRQSLDRVVPGIRARQWESWFADAGGTSSR